MRIRRFFHTVLAVIALGIIWQTVHTWSRALPGVQPSAPAREPERPATALPARALQIGQRLARQITDKDLFAPDRQRPVVVQQAVAIAPPPPPAHLTLVGVLLTPGREEAFLANSSQGNRVTRVQKGELIERYRLTHLSASEATLSLGDSGGEVALPLVLLSSQKAKSLPRLTPKKAAAKPARQPDKNQAAAVKKAGGEDPAQPSAKSPPAVEADGDDPAEIRENIRQLQRRLRLIRRQAARERRAERAKEERAEAEAQAAESE